MITVKSAKPGKGYISPRYHSRARFIVLAASRLYLWLAEKVSSVTLINPAPLCHALKEQQEGKYALLILFKHSDKADAPLLTYALNVVTRKQGRKQGIKITKRPHTLFLYGKDVPNWAGAAAGWIFPRLGHIPVVNRGLCRESIDDIKKALQENRFPLALAPEGQVTYHGGTVFKLEAGLGHMTDWAADYGPVRLLPVIPIYDYAGQKYSILKKVRKKWMAETGFELEPIQSPCSFLKEITEKTVTLLEKSFPQAVKGKQGKDKNGNVTEREKDGSLDERIQALNEAILHEGETILGIKKSGDFLDRIFRIRYKGVKTFYPETRNPAEDSPWERSASDFNCIKTAYAVRCSQIADVLEYIHTDYISEEPLNNRHCEYALNILDVINRFRGGDIGTRYVPKIRKAYLHTGNIIDPALFKDITEKKERHRVIRDKVKEELKVRRI